MTLNGIALEETLIIPGKIDNKRFIRTGIGERNVIDDRNDPLSPKKCWKFGNRSGKLLSNSKLEVGGLNSSVELLWK